MTKKIVLIFFFVLILVSCSKVGQKGQQKLLDNSQINLDEKISEYAANYKVNFGDIKKLPLIPIFSEINTKESNVELYYFKKGNKEKTLTKGLSLDIMTSQKSMMVSSYKLGQDSFSCVQDLLSKSSEINKTTCYRVKNEKMELYLNKYIKDVLSNFNPKDISIILVGKKQLIGRACDEFSIEIKSPPILINYSSSILDIFLVYFDKTKDSKSNTIGKINLCVDDETGIVLDVKTFINTTSDLYDYIYSNVTMPKELVSYEILSLQTKVDDDEFELPAKYRILGFSRCHQKDFLVLFDFFENYNGIAKINTYNSNYPNAGKTIVGSIELPQQEFMEGKLEKLRFDLSQSKTYNLDPEVCINNECSSISCHLGIYTECLDLSNNKESCEEQSYCIHKEPICKTVDCGRGPNLENCESYSICGLAISPYGGNSYCAFKTCNKLLTKEDCEATVLKCQWNETANICSGGSVLRY